MKNQRLGNVDDGVDQKEDAAGIVPPLKAYDLSMDDPDTERELNEQKSDDHLGRLQAARRCRFPTGMSSGSPACLPPEIEGELAPGPLAAAPVGAARRTARA